MCSLLSLHEFAQRDLLALPYACPVPASDCHVHEQAQHLFRSYAHTLLSSMCRPQCCRRMLAGCGGGRACHVVFAGSCLPGRDSQTRGRQAHTVTYMTSSCIGCNMQTPDTGSPLWCCRPALASRQVVHNGEPEASVGCPASGGLPANSNHDLGTYMSHKPSSQTEFQSLCSSSRTSPAAV